MDWKYIYYTSGIMVIFLLVLFGIYFFNNLRVFNRNRKEWQVMQESIKVGKTVIFNGIYGRVTHIGEDYLEVEIGKDVIVKIAKYSVNKVI